MGLAVVRSLAEQYGGSAWVEAAADAPGSRFVVELPRASAAAVAQETDASHAAERS
jgi:signal transduction histidine kinase